MKKNLLLLLALLTSLAATPARADEENLLAYSEDTEIAPAGHWEVYHWLTNRTGKEVGSYGTTDYYLEGEYGLTPHSQLSVYLTAADYRITSVPGLDDRRSTNYTGLRLAYKHLLRDHEQDGYGLAFYLEPEYSARSEISGARRDEFGLETKLIYQRESRSEKYVYLANLTFEPELARTGGVTEHEFKFEFSHGATMRLGASRWYLGAENRWTAVFSGWQLAHAGTHAGFVGPTLHYAATRWWFTAAWQRQFTGWPAARRGLALEEFTRDEFRLKFGVDL